MAIVYKEKTGPTLVGGKPVRFARYKDGEILFYNKLKGHWEARDITESDINDLSSAETYESVSKNLKSYPYVITYDGDDIDYITYDLGGGLTIVKTFNYTIDDLTSLVLSGDTPSGIDLTKTLGYTGENLTSVVYS